LATKNIKYSYAMLQKKQHYQALVNGVGKGQVPCLKIEPDSGKITWMYESDDILGYIREHNGPVG